MGIFGSKDDQPVTATDTSASLPTIPGPVAVESPAPAMPVAAPAPDLAAPAPAVLPPAPAAPAATDSYIMTPTPEPAAPALAPVEIAPPTISAPFMPVDPAPVTPVLDIAAPAAGPAIDPAPAVSLPDISSLGGGDLSALKQKALQELSPLVSHLDQSPEERFQTTMMMLQATDDQSLIQKAYDTAQEITDEKTRAQALLDVINEINYFTQQKTD